MQPQRAFLSYAHADMDFYNRFKPHLTAVKRAFGLPIWTDHQITGGTLWEDSIARAIAEAQVFFLLMTPSFIGSDYVFDTELPAIALRQASGALVLPVLLRPCIWDLVVKARLVVPRNTSNQLHAISDWQPQESGFHASSVQIIKAIAAHFGVSSRGPAL